ncbi:MAG: ParB/RepB/Spo0J family partition protein [bacterium]
MNIQTIPIKEIQLEGPNFDDFIFTYPLNSRDLVDSIKKVGLLHPVCLRTYMEGWQIVYGAKRILACKELGWHEIPAQIVSVEEVSDMRALEMSLAEDILQRALNPIEKAMVFYKYQILGNWQISRLVNELAPQLGLPQSVEMVQNYISLLKLEKEIKIAVAHGSLTPAHAFLLLPLKPAERITIFKEVFKKCNPNLNEGREVINNLIDLKAIFKESIAEILSNKTMEDFLNSPTKSPREKCGLLRMELKKLRYPRLSNLESKFYQALNNLSLKNNIQVRPSPYFEENHLDIAFRIKDPADLKQTLDSLTGASKNGGIDKLFEIVKGEL